MGETTESLPAAYTGEPLEIGFNAEFLADGVDSVRGDTVRLKLINPLRPGLITSARRFVLVPDHADQARGLIVAEVTLRDFRSYPRLELALEPGLVLVTGPTAPGRPTCSRRCTSATQGFSPRTRSDMRS